MRKFSPSFVVIMFAFWVSSGGSFLFYKTETMFLFWSSHHRANHFFAFLDISGFTRISYVCTLSLPKIFGFVFSFDAPKVDDEDIIFEDFARLRVRAANHDQNDDFEPSWIITPEAYFNSSSNGILQYICILLLYCDVRMH